MNEVVKMELLSVKGGDRKEVMVMSVEEHNKMVNMSVSGRIKYMKKLDDDRIDGLKCKSKYSGIANYLGIKVQYVRNVLVKV